MKRDATYWANYISTADSLYQLCDRLNEMLEWGNKHQGTTTGDLRKDIVESIDTTDLPVFGGEEPADTEGIYSWDEDSYLIPGGDYRDDWQIVPRNP